MKRFRIRGGIGPGMFDGAVQGCMFLIVVIVVVAFVAGILVTGCYSKYGHPSVSWAKGSAK